MRLTIVDCNSEFCVCFLSFHCILLSCAAMFWRNKKYLYSRPVQELSLVEPNTKDLTDSDRASEKERLRAITQVGIKPLNQLNVEPDSSIGLFLRSSQQ